MPTETAGGAQPKGTQLDWTGDKPAPKPPQEIEQDVGILTVPRARIAWAVCRECGFASSAANRDEILTLNRVVRRHVKQTQHMVDTAETLTRVVGAPTTIRVVGRDD